MAPRECSVRRADREPGKSSGHLEAHCYRERSTNATGKTYRCQTGESLFLQNTNSLDIIHEPKCVMLYIQVYIQSVLFIRRIVGRFETYFHHTFAGPQFCCGLFGKITSSVITHSGQPVLQVFTHINLCFSLHVDQHCIILCLSGLLMPSLTMDWCCSLRSCFRREVHVEVSHCLQRKQMPSHTQGHTHI